MNILIADSGGTKTDWAWTDGTERKLFKTKGWHPVSLNKEMINHTKAELLEVLENIDVIYFYGSGIKNDYDKIKNALAQLSPAIAIIQSDLKGACIATLGNTDGFCGIIGTGVIACAYYDDEIKNITSGRGHLLGDEGSGYDIGKRLITISLENPNSEIAKTLFNVYSPNHLENILNEKNKFEVASITKLIENIKDHPEVQFVLKEVFEEFFFTAIQPLGEQGEINLVGSIAYHFENEISNVLNSHNWKIKSVIQQPISALLDYHLSELTD